MIIGTITLISILLSGGTFNTMFIEKADMYASKVVLDKERAKEIKEIIKRSKREIKVYAKDRKSLIKELKH